MEDKCQPYSYIQYHCFWWPGDARSQGISRHVIDPEFPECSCFHERYGFVHTSPQTVSLLCKPMAVIVSQITGNSTVYSIVCSGQHRRKHEIPHCWPFVREPLMTGGFPVQSTDKVEGVSMAWRQDAITKYNKKTQLIPINLEPYCEGRKLKCV